MHKLFGIIGLLFLCFAGLLFYETNALEVEHVTVTIDGLPAAFEGFRIALLTDLHGQPAKSDGRLMEEIQKAEVDIVALTGDFVDSSTSELDNVLPLMRKLSSLYPSFAVSGNHDYVGWPEISRRLHDAGITVLENSYVRLVRGKETIVISGVSDPYTRRDRLQDAIPEKAEGPIILLAHSPTIFTDQTYIPVGSGGRTRKELLRRVSLTLAGHTHGGQIKLPLIGAVTTATGQPFPRERVEGLSREGTGWLYVSRGLGETRIPLRFLSRRELTVITLTGT